MKILSFKKKFYDFSEIVELYFGLKMENPKISKYIQSIMRVQVSTVVRLPQRLKYTFLKTSFFTSQFLPNSEFSL